MLVIVYPFFSSIFALLAFYFSCSFVIITYAFCITNKTYFSKILLSLSLSLSSVSILLKVFVFFIFSFAPFSSLFVSAFFAFAETYCFANFSFTCCINLIRKEFLLFATYFKTKSTLISIRLVSKNFALFIYI